ncbi:MAG: hypothetical protein R2781_06300 [Flavobacteriaceae bacterium]
MKRLLLVLAIFVVQITFSQQTYSIQGENLSLYAEADGTLTLLWNSFEGNYRYFIKKGEVITELKNTKLEGAYQEEYKTVLQNYTGNEASKLKFTKSDLKNYIDTYNAAADSTYVSQIPSVNLKTRLGGFAGMTNYPYFVNPENTVLPQIGIDFEIIDEIKLKRHSMQFQFRQIFGNKDYDFSSSQLSLNYRFKFVKWETFDVFVNTKIADYVYISQDIDVIENNGDTTNIKGSGGDFQAPFALGIGADIALGNGYITLLYQDIVALNLTDNGEFPIDFAIGYKWKL